MAGTVPNIADLIGGAYDAATGTTAWPEFGNLLRAHFAAGVSNMFLTDAASVPLELLDSAGFSDRARDDFLTYFHRADPWIAGGTRKLARAPERRHAWLGQELIGDAALRESEFYRDFARHVGAFHNLAGGAALGSDGVLGIGLFRPEDAPAFGAAEQAALISLLPHLHRALRLRQQLALSEGMRGIAAAALDAVPAALAIVDASLRVLLVNRPLEHLSAQKDGPRLQRMGPHPSAATVLGASHDADRKTLAALVRNAAQGGAGGGMRFSRASKRRPVAALVMPLPARLDPRGRTGPAVMPGLALILMRDLSDEALPAARWLKSLFGLTEAEAAVAQAAAGGSTAEDIARLRGTSPATVRGQIRQILEKTQAANIRDLTSMLARLA